MPKVVPEYKEEARSRILEAANQVFNEKGYRQATMDDVAKKLGVSKGALYLYFASKEELFEAICRTQPLALRDILYSSFGDGRRPFESASGFFDKMLKQYGSNPGLGFEIFSEASRNPGLRRVLRKTQDEFTEILTSFLEQMRKKQLVSGDLDLVSLARALIALYNGLESMLVSGLSVDETRRAWLEGLKAMFSPHASTAFRNQL
jgi:AcrR family transcriptional regulator